MKIIHQILNLKKLSIREVKLIQSLKKDKIISVVNIGTKVGIARYGTNRGKNSQLYKWVKAHDA